MSADVTKKLLEALKGLLVRAADDEEYGPNHAVTVARVAIARAEAAPKAVRLTHPDIAKALASAGLKPEDCREDGEILPLVLAIESAALRKNGIEVAE